MSDLVVSLIRTYVPVVVGTVIAWLVAQGIDVTPETEVQLVAGLTGIISAAYYGVVRLLERRWPVVGYLLGSKKQPTYED